MHWFFSRRKGEAVFRAQDSVLAVSGGTPQPVYRTLHFGVKPGHVVYVRNAEYVLTDPGYINHFRPEADGAVRLNTLRAQRLLGRARMFVWVTNRRIRVFLWTVFPLHFRYISAPRDLASLRVLDAYLGRRTVDWAGPGISSRKAWFIQKFEC